MLKKAAGSITTFRGQRRGRKRKWIRGDHIHYTKKSE
jgi:hypothetical protein